MFVKSTLATWRIAEFGFFGDIVTTLVTIPFTCGHLFNIGVLESVGFLYFKPGLSLNGFLWAPCIHVAKSTDYITKNCQDKPNQYISAGIPKNNRVSLVVRSIGNFILRKLEKPNIIFIHDLKKKVGPNKYRKINKKRDITGNRSKKNVKNKNSDTKKIDPGNPRKIKVLSNMARNNLGHIKFIPLISVISRVLNRLAIASTNKNELVESNAWLIIIQKLDNIKFDWPLTIHIVNQCISTTVE